MKIILGLLLCVAIALQMLSMPPALAISTWYMRAGAHEYVRTHVRPHAQSDTFTVRNCNFTCRGRVAERKTTERERQKASEREREKEKERERKR